MAARIAKGYRGARWLSAGPGSVRSRQRTALVAAFGCALLAPRLARADTLAELRAENARLTAEVQSLRARVAALQDASRSEGTAVAAGGARMEQVYVPRSRISLEVTPDGATGRSSIATQWYRTADVGPLPRKEWLQLRAQLSPSGAVEGTFVLLERQGGGGGAKVAAARLTVDGRDIELPVTDHDTKRTSRSIGPIDASTSSERIRFAIPASALPLVASSHAAHFSAGAVDFDLTDEHMAAFAALAARLQAAPAPATASKD